jgi:DNA-binding CsgD family transcriptional regulator
VLFVITFENKIMGFKGKFNQTNPRFLENLLNKYSLLTQREITHCMFLKSNYSSNDISDELAISKTSVDTYRYNLREKIGVERKASLISHSNTLQ